MKVKGIGWRRAEGYKKVRKTYKKNTGLYSARKLYAKSKRGRGLKKWSKPRKTYRKSYRSSYKKKSYSRRRR